MTDENQHLLEKLYQQYNDPIKPLLAEIEAVYENFRWHFTMRLGQ